MVDEPRHRRPRARQRLTFVHGREAQSNATLHDGLLHRPAVHGLFPDIRHRDPHALVHPSPASSSFASGEAVRSWRLAIPRGADVRAFWPRLSHRPGRGLQPAHSRRSATKARARLTSDAMESIATAGGGSGARLALGRPNLIPARTLQRWGSRRHIRIPAPPFAPGRGLMLAVWVLSRDEVLNRCGWRLPPHRDSALQYWPGLARPFGNAVPADYARAGTHASRRVGPCALTVGVAHSANARGRRLARPMRTPNATARLPRARWSTVRAC